MSRFKAVLVFMALALCLMAGSTPRMTGDGGEYVALGLNLASLHRPAIDPTDIGKIEQAIGKADASLNEWDLRAASVAGQDGRRDLLHFWVYPLLAVPALWITQTIGVTPIAAFAITNVLLLALALWIALPRVGAATSILLFGGPIIWWLDKPHSEPFTFSMLVIACLLMRERPGWAIVAAGAAAAQNTPIGLFFVLVGATQIATRPALLRDRAFRIAAAVGLCLAVLQPAYTLLRHGTPTLLLRANPSHVPSAAELRAVIFDPEIGLVANFPAFAVIVFAALVLVLVRRRRELIASDILVTAVSAAGFVFSFAQATNVHHGGTPSMSRYALWLIPLAMPLLRRARDLGHAAWRAGSWCLAVSSAAVCAFVFHPGVPQNGREPTVVANFLWIHHPSWNNPLPEVFAESLMGREDRWVPIGTSDCDKVLLMGRGDGSAFPLPCFPAPLPAECSMAGRLCYANRDGSHYRFTRAPGSPIQLEGFTFQPDWTWPREAEPHVRDLLTQWEWWTLTPKTQGDDVLRLVQDAHVVELEGPRRFLFVIRPSGPDAQLALRLPSKMTGVLADAMTGATVASPHYDGEPFDRWDLNLPAGFKLLLLFLHAS